MIRFYELHHSIEPKIVGVRTGLGQAYTTDKFYAENPWYEAMFNGKPPTDKDWWRKWMNMPDYGGPLNDLLLHKAAKLTDIVDSNILVGYVVSDKVRTLLEKFTLPRHRYFEASFIRNTQITSGYWWLVYDLDDGSKTVNFKKSEFDYRWHEKNFGKQFIVNNYQDYLDLIYVTGRSAQANKLVFNKNFNYDLDLWGTQFLSIFKGYISPKLSEVFKESKVSGYQLKEPRCKLIFE